MPDWISILQIVIVVALMIVFYRSFIRNSSSEKLVRGLLGVLLIWGFSFIFSWMNLNILAGFTYWAALFISLGVVMVFQPELRKFLMLMGNMDRVRDLFFSKNKTKSVNSIAVGAIMVAVEYMSAKHIGALIVFRNPLDFEAIEKKGTKLDAVISTELLLTLFHNKTPLHDGAVIIESGRIRYAGAILPLSTNNLDWKYGTRHRAALGLSQASKSVALVVSEESGDISIAENGKLTKYEDMKKLGAKLERVMGK